jgi:hypothetical protein
MKTPDPQSPVLARKDIRLDPGQTPEATTDRMAELLLSPEMSACRVIAGAERGSSLNDKVDLPAVLDQLRRQTAEMNGGSLVRAESMLQAQATALQVLFGSLAERGMACKDGEAFETNMRVALRAQSQCRATLETLAMLKNPPVVFAKQANVANNQQINVGVPSGAREIKAEPSKLSGGSDELCPNSRAPALAGGVEPTVEAVAAVDRAKVRRR